MFKKEQIRLDVFRRGERQCLALFLEGGKKGKEEQWENTESEQAKAGVPKKKSTGGSFRKGSPLEKLGGGRAGAASRRKKKGRLHE